MAEVPTHRHQFATSRSVTALLILYTIPAYLEIHQVTLSPKDRRHSPYYV